MYNRKVIMSILIMLMIFAQIGNNALAGVILKQDGVSASGTKVITPGPLLDDFRYKAPVNVWNAATGTFSRSAAASPPANESCTASYVVDSDAARGNCLKLNYKVSALNTYAGYYSSLGSASLASPVAYTAVSFYVKGAAGGEFFKIELKNTSATKYFDSANNANYYRNESVVYITDYLDGGVTTGWKKVTIPLHNFANLDGFSSMKEFVIVFENSQSVANNSLTSGTVYIDNITFEAGAVNAVRIDHFGDKLGVDALGGGMGEADILGDKDHKLITAAFSNGTNEYYTSPYGLSLNYNVSGTNAWAAMFFVFGGGIDPNPDPLTSKSGWIAIPHDFSAYNTLSISIRGKSSTENPKTMKIELVDSGGTKSYVIAGITTNWQALKIPLSSFPLLKKDSIKQITFVLEGWRIEQAAGNKAGTVFIDSVQFE